MNKNYQFKYLKYKNKYLLLKHNNLIQIGGNVPNISVIKNISLFLPESDLDLHFNPIYGFLYSITYIDNVLKLFPHNNEYIIVNKCFHELNNVVRLTNKLYNINIDEFTKLIVYLYLQHNFKNEIINIAKKN